MMQKDDPAAQDRWVSRKPKTAATSKDPGGKGIPRGSQPQDPQPRPMPEQLLNVTAVAVLLGIDKGYVYDLAKRGTIPSVKVGRYLRFSPCALAQWIEDQHSIRE